MTPVQDLRRAARERFEELGFPTRKNEEWKYTSVARIARTPFEPGSGLAEPPAGIDPLPDLACHRLVFVNGRYRKELSSPDGIETGGLEAAAGHLARYANYSSHPFVALNTASLEDAAFVRIPAGKVLEKPLYLLFIAVGERTMSNPRALILAGAGAQAHIIEAYAGQGEYFTNAVTELALGEGAVVDHYKLQRESAGASHIATLQVHQERASVFTSHSVSLGGALVRNDINSAMAGEGCECTLNGLYLASGEQHVDNHTVLDHAKPHCASREYYRGILSGHATGVFNGKIIVRKDAQKTDAIQSNKNLLLSPDASINTKPQLEIYADDVRCTHGATVGQLDAEALFYLMSRGIGRDEARRTLTVAFASDVLDRIRLKPLRARLEQCVKELL
jgi:Fe-S cluster assembly protein SufD